MKATDCPACNLPHDGACHPDLLAAAEAGRAEYAVYRVTPYLPDAPTILELVGVYAAILTSVLLSGAVLVYAARAIARAVGAA